MTGFKQKAKPLLEVGWIETIIYTSLCSFFLNSQILYIDNNYVDINIFALIFKANYCYYVRKRDLNNGGNFTFRNLDLFEDMEKA